MFKNWQQEKATAALIDEAQALADRLANSKPHILDSHTAFAQFWAASYHENGQDLLEMSVWKPAAVARFASATETKIAAMRKKREYDSSDGLTIWLHTARAVTEPRLAPAVRQIWDLLMMAGPNADSMADDLLQDAGLPVRQTRGVPRGFLADG